MEGKCTIYFEDPFWVGIFERIDNNTIAIARHVFGGEPTDAELYRFVLEDYRRLEFSAPIPTPAAVSKPRNFKRAQREARRSTQPAGIGTLAQRAIQAERERHKQVRQEDQRALRSEQAERKFKLKQERKKQRQRGH